MKRHRLKIALSVFMHLLLQVLFSHINLFGFLSCVGLPFAFSKLFFETNIFLVTGFYLVSRIFMFNELKWILITAYEIVFLALYYFAKEFIKTDKKFLLCNLFLVFSNILLMYFELQTLAKIFEFVLNFVCQILVLMFFYKFNRVYKNKLVFYKFSRSDYFVFSLMVFLLGLGLFSFEIIHVKFGLFVVVLLSFFGAKILSIDRFLISLIIVSISTVIATNNYFLFKFTIIFSVAVVLIKDYKKQIYVILNALIITILMICFKIDDIFILISIIFAIFCYMCIPQKFINNMTILFETDATNLIVSKCQDEKVEEVKNRLLLMSDTLNSMQNNFKFLLVGKIDREKACVELSNDIIDKCCSNCENYKYCFLQNINKKSMFENLLLKAIECKQITISDLSNGIEAYCHKGGIVASEVNQMAKRFLSFESAMKTQDESKLMISSEIENFADIFKNFAKTIINSLKINKKLSKFLKEGFINSLVDVKEAIILENENGIEMINIIAPNEQVLKRELLDVIAKTIRNNVIIKKLVHLEQSGLSLVTFIPKPKINIQFAVGSKAKELRNGDSSVITKISDNKYFIAIADGMGHGEQANKLSSMVLNMIKSMFEVGLDGELILQSVNKLLIPAGLDNFTTFDACVIDLDKTECCFIKLGSSVSILKHKETSEIITSQSLPIGIVQNIKPTVIKKQIFQGDMIFLASDGVVDSFSSIQNYSTFVNDAKIYNLQKFVDDVVFDAQNLNTKHIDDMTIIGINLLKN